MENLIRMTYPGRLIIIGADPANAFGVVVYGITGRSPSSQARRLELSGETIWTRPTDPDVIKTGNADLLVYPALILGAGIAVSNGRQTAGLDLTADENPVLVLAKGLKGWTYEPDGPIFTPRIAGCLLPNGRAGLAIIRRSPDGSPERSYYEFPLVPGQGKFIATYGGENGPAPPAFRGEPLDLRLEEKTAETTAEAVYAALRPEGRAEDFRVALACVFSARGIRGERRVAILNRVERTNP
jgi:hypothetical protein